MAKLSRAISEHDVVQSPTQHNSKTFPVSSPPPSGDPTQGANSVDESPTRAVPPKKLNSAFSTVMNAAFSTVMNAPPMASTSPSPPIVELPVGGETLAMVHSEAEGPERDSRSRLLSSRQASVSSSSSPPRLQARRAQTPTSPPRVATNPRRGLTRRMSSLEEKPQLETRQQTATSGSDAEDEQESHATPNGSRKRRPSDNRGSLQLGASSCRTSRGKRQSCESESSFSAYGSTPRSSLQISTARSSFQVPDSPQHSVPRALTGVVITSSRQSQRRCSSASAAAAFAVATAGSSNPRDNPNTPLIGGRFSIVPGVDPGRRPSFKDRPTRQESIIISTAATMRVLNVLRHWVSKHSQDFESDLRLRNYTIEFLQDLVCSPTLLPAENKAASQLLRLLTKEEQAPHKVDLATLLSPPPMPSKESIETLSALELAEQMTYIDHQIFSAIRSEEFLKTAWMKADKQLKAANILLITKRFNDMSRLVVSEVIRGLSVAFRVTVIEKWVAVADICRCLHNFNGVLQVCAAFQNSSVFRLKKTWEKVSKTTRQTLDKLQSLVSSDGRFRSLRDALHRCDPPCIPYLGMYLTDLSFIEEGTPNFTEDGLLNFSKMRMIAHVIREIRHFQQTPYKIEHSPKVTNYLLDPTRLVSDDDLYKQSLELEPRRATLTPASAPSLAVLTSLQGVAAHLQQPKHDHKQDQKHTQCHQTHEVKRQQSHYKQTKTGSKHDPESPPSSRSPDFKDQPRKQGSLSKSDPGTSHDSPQDENLPPTPSSMTS